MFSAIVVTRTLLKLMVGTSVMRHLWLFGADVAEARQRATTGGLATPARAPRSPQP